MTTTDSTTQDNASTKKQSKLQLRLLRARRKDPLLDHTLDTLEHFSAVKGSIQAGGITYFGFLSFFPILALAFALVGFLAKIYPDAEADLISAINSLFPGLVGNEEGQISLDTIRDAAPGIFSVGLLVVLYSGLGWLSSTRTALLVMFELPEREQPNFVFGKLRDLIALVILGVILLLSVSVAGVMRGLSQEILDFVGLGDQLGWLVAVVAVVVGLAANMLLFYALFRVLAQPEMPAKALWSGALVGGVAFEILKQVSQLLLEATANSPAFQAFGIALILLVWINYFARVVLYAASWAHTSPIAIAARPNPPAILYGPPSPRYRRRDDRSGPAWVKPFAAGGAAMLALVAVVRHRR